MSFLRLCALGVLGLLGSACTEFPNIPANGCGNRVIDGAEDCDFFAREAGTVCRAPGSAFECHLDCSVRESGRVPCPEGWGCDADSVCRKPSGEFTEPSVALDVSAWSLSSGDFDGDGRDDVMSSEPLDSIGATRLRFFYFDKQGALADTRPFAKSLLSPMIHELSGDGRSDLVFTTGALGVMLGRADRSQLPETFSSYRIPNATVRVVGINDRAVQFASPFASLISYPHETGFYIGDSETGLLTNRVRIQGRVDELVGDLVSGNLIEDSKHSPCLEPVLAMRGSNRFNVVNLCDTEESGAPIWRADAELFVIALDPPAAIDAAPQVLDFNRDGHLDVLLGAGGRPYISYGDGSTLSTAIRLDFAGKGFPKGTPLAVADITGDGALDFVFADRLMLSMTAYAGAIPEYTPIGNRLSAPWTTAKIADFNGNRHLDVVAASSGSLNLEFFNGTSTPNLGESLVTTSAPVQMMTAGDFDGDLITDLALFEAPLPGQAKSTLKISFGVPLVALVDPVAVAQVMQPAALNSYKNAGLDNLTVCSSELIRGENVGALTLLSSGPDHVPFAPFTLTDFSNSGSVQDAGAFAVVAGHFTQVDQPDLMALAFSPRGDGTTPKANVWWLPAVTTNGSFPKMLPGTLHPRLNAIEFAFDNSDYTADVAVASGDLTNDLRDEAIFAMPADGGAHCGLLVVGVDAAGALGNSGREPVIIPEPCSDPQILPIRANDDDYTDLAVLTGKTGADDRHLYVLWNDGNGGFSGADLSLISAADSPQAFTVVESGQGRPAIAYVTKDSLRVVHAASEREFPAPVGLPTVPNLFGGSGITAADVNGDDVTDLVIAESGKLSVLRAQLKVQ